ncbi:hypothetical protein FNH22_01550 [Fulvivirga sp. M361]|uniref:hypothetical protein n=1 Tax=Fulvivirga sp. M361 TaxID=2594266 RepID=UPI00117AC674|nr:hypothetical protein [Fulvivirga sp. M361]TRX62035.1 hypothetical protein FNH22_01550 [Fulvivirga sp. M361]
MESNLLRFVGYFLILLLQAPGVAQNVEVTYGPILRKMADGGIGVWIRTSGAGTLYVKYGPNERQLSDSVAISTRTGYDLTGWTRLSNLKSNKRCFSIQ